MVAKDEGQEEKERLGTWDEQMQTATEVWILLGDTSLWSFVISAYLVNTTLISLCSRLLFQSESEATQSCPTLCDPMDCSLPRSSVHGILQAIVLEWIAIPFSRGSSQPRDRTWVFRIVDRHFTI